MITMTITPLDGKNKDCHIKNIKDEVDQVKSKLVSFGFEVASVMRNNIAALTKRKPSSGNLAKNITAERTITGMGVGNVSRLNSNAPYWKVVNDGGVIPPKTWGYFPGPSGPVTGHSGTERWTVTGDTKDWYIDPQKPMTPMYYIEHTVNWIHINFPTYFTNKKITQI